AAPPAAPVDFRELGHVRQQPEGEVLCHHEGRAETARRAGGELGTDLHGDHADAPPGGSVAQCVPGSPSSRRGSAGCCPPAAWTTTSIASCQCTWRCSRKTTSAGA